MLLNTDELKCRTLSDNHRRLVEKAAYALERVYIRARNTKHGLLYVEAIAHQYPLRIEFIVQIDEDCVANIKEIAINEQIFVGEEFKRIIVDELHQCFDSLIDGIFIYS